MTRTAEVVVVGSGIIGASIAYQLARHGVGNVIALDKGKGPSEGSTGASSSVIRCKYSNPQVVRLAFHGQESYGNWKEFTGLTEPRSGLQQLGVLWMMGHSTSDVEADAAMLVSQGVSARSIGPDEVGSMFPALSDCGSILDFEDPDSHVCVPGEAFLFETNGGHADPVGANQDLIEAARQLGVEVDFNSTVTSVLREDGRVTGVRLADGSEISAGLVINASGPWCNQLNQMAGADLRWTLSPIRAQIVYTTWPADLGPLPVAGDNSTGIYFRPQSGGQQVLIGSFLPEDEEEVIDDPDDFKKVPDADFIEMKLAAFQHRVPVAGGTGPGFGSGRALHHEPRGCSSGGGPERCRRVLGGQRLFGAWFQTGPGRGIHGGPGVHRTRPWSSTPTCRWSSSAWTGSRSMSRSRTSWPE